MRQINQEKVNVPALGLALFCPKRELFPRTPPWEQFPNDDLTQVNMASLIEKWMYRWYIILYG